MTSPRELSGERNRGVVKEIGWIAAWQLVWVLGTVLGIKLLTVLLGPDGYGRLALTLTLTGAIGMFVYGPLGQTILRLYALAHARQELGYFLHSVTRNLHIAGAVSVAVTAVAALAGLIIGGPQWLGMMSFAGMLAVAGGVLTACSALHNAMRDRRRAAGCLAADALSRPLAAAAAVALLGPSVVWALCGQFVAGAALSVVLWKRTVSQCLGDARWRLERWDPEVWARTRASFRAYQLPFFFFAVFGAIVSFGDRWLIHWLHGFEVVGIYFAILQIASAPITIAINVLVQYVAPILFDRAGTLSTRDQLDHTARAQAWTVVIAIVISVFLVGGASLVSEPVVRLLTTPEFARHHDLLWMLCASVALFQIGQVMILKGLYLTRPTIYILPKALQALAFLGLIAVFATPGDVRGVATAALLSSLVYVLAVATANGIVRAPEEDSPA